MPARIFGILICLFIIAGLVQGASESKPGIITGDAVNFRAGPGLDGRVISVLRKGLPVSIVTESGQWYYVQLADGTTGWICRKYVEVKPATPEASGEVFAAVPAAELIAYAKSLFGIKYVYGGQSLQGFDCSGFTRHVFAKFGINLPRRADLQMEAGMAVGSREDLLPGDLVFFMTGVSAKVNHVGIYVGDGLFIHAATRSGVRVDPLNSGYYKNYYVAGRRLIKPNDGETGETPEEDGLQ